MYEVNAECGRSVRISYQGENKRTVVHFDLSDIIAEFPGGTAALVIRRYGDTDPVPSSTTELVGTELLWTVTAWECAKRGSLYAQVIYSTSDEVVAKTKIFRFDVADSLTASAEEPEDWEDWVDSLLEAAAQIQTDLSGKLDTPETAGTAGQVLTSDGQGGQSWETPFVPASIIDDTAGSGDTDKVWSADKLVDELAEKYEKPASGIPATDLADGVIPVITGKADKVSGAVSGNFAALDSNGNLIDSGHKHSDYLTEHQDISGKMDEPQSEGTNGQVLTTDGNGGRTWTTPSGGDPTSIIDDTAGAGDTNKVWSADKSASENQALNGAINANSESISDLQKDKAPIILDTASGEIASFPDGADGLPVEHLVVGIEPVQSGSGDPSPSNVRPITGWTGCNVTIAPTSDPDDPDKVVKSVSWETEAGTVYGGTLELTTGVLTVNGMLEVFNETDTNIIKSKLNSFNSTNGSVSTVGDYTRITFAVINYDQSAYNRVSSSYPSNRRMCNMAKHYFAYNDESTHWYRNTVLYLFLPTTVCGSTAESVYNYLVSIKDTNPATFWVELATPTTYQLTPVQVASLLGQNNIFADTGNSSVTYRADTELFVQKSLPSVPVQDVQVNGTSILSQGVANVPVATYDNAGVIKLNATYGLAFRSSPNQDTVMVARASSANIKGGQQGYQPIVPGYQHESTFYGLAKAAGDSTQASSANAVGTYTADAKRKITDMIEPQFRKIAEVTTTNSQKVVEITTDLNGNSLSLKEFLAEINMTIADGNSTGCIAINRTNESLSSIAMLAVSGMFKSSASGLFYARCEVVGGRFFGRSSSAISNYYTPVNETVSKNATGIFECEKINKIQFLSLNDHSFGDNSVITIYGR